MDQGGVVRVLIVDDHPLFREGLRYALAQTPDIVVVGEAGTAEQALDLVARCAPDVVIMDLTLPGTSGIDATRAIRARHPQVRVLAMTVGEEDGGLPAVLRAGARGYLVKGAGRAEVVHAVHTVAANGAVFSPSIAERFAAFVEAADRAPDTRAFPRLTPREREVLDLLARGHDNRRIARELHLSEKTVRNLVSAIFAKLDVPGRPQAIVLAREAGLGR